MNRKKKEKRQRKAILKQLEAAMGNVRTFTQAAALTKIAVAQPSRREFFTAAALTGLVTVGEYPPSKTPTIEDYAREAVAIADATIAELNKQTHPAFASGGVMHGNTQPEG